MGTLTDCELCWLVDQLLQREPRVSVAISAILQSIGLVAYTMQIKEKPAAFAMSMVGSYR